MTALYARVYPSDRIHDPSREQVRKVYLVAEQCGYDDDAIEAMLRDCPTSEDCDRLISRLGIELIDVVRGLR